MTKEEKNNVTRLSALCSITTIYIQGCKKTIEEANTKVLKEQYKYDTLSLPNKKVVDKKIQEAIEKTGLRLESNKEIGQLSKGYRQRVGLAAAILHDPEVLILDEPTTGLDPNQILEIRSLIRQLGKEKTILFSSHILQEVEAICDHVVIIHRGNIVANESMGAIQSLQDQQHITVQFSGSVSSEALMSLPGIQEVESNKQGAWILKTARSVDLSKELMSFALQHNLNIVSLQAQTRQLEDVFKELTGL